MLPQKVADLRARQVGDRLVVSCARPRARDDGTPLPDAASLEILLSARAPAPRRAAEIAEAPSLSWSIPRRQWERYAQGDRLDVTLGLGRIAAELGLADPAALRGRPLTFTAVVSEPRDRRSPAADPATLTVCAPPPPPDALRGRLVEEGVLLEWRAGEAAPVGTAWNVYRRERDGPRPATPLNPAPVVEPAFLDAAAALGVLYRYEVRAAAIASAGCESEAARPLEAERADLFPPGPPQGLTAVAEGRAIRLFWRPNMEPDLRGYRVWRADGPAAAPRLLRTQLVTSTTYNDEDVTAGVVYSYAITAVDGAAPPNESPYSDAAVETAGRDR